MFYKFTCGQVHLSFLVFGFKISEPFTAPNGRCYRLVIHENYPYNGSVIYSFFVS